MHVTPEQYESKDVQELLDSIKSGKAQRDLNRDNEKDNRVSKITMTYWTDAKIKNV